MTAKKKTRQVLRVRTGGGTFRRAGFTFSEQPTDFGPDDIGPEAVEAIMAEPRLHAAFTDVEVDEDPKDGEGVEG